MDGEEESVTGEKVPLEELLPIWKEIFDGGGEVIFTPRGRSMLPFLRSEKDRVRLRRPKGEELQTGEIILCRRPDGVIVLHRIVEIKDGFLTLCGDGLSKKERRIAPDAAIAVVEAFSRNERWIDCRKNRRYRFLARLWVRLYPLRFFILSILRGLKRLAKFAVRPYLRRRR